jgi:hypothetical protein
VHLSCLSDSPCGALAPLQLPVSWCHLRRHHFSDEHSLVWPRLGPKAFSCFRLSRTSGWSSCLDKAATVPAGLDSYIIPRASPSVPFCATKELMPPRRSRASGP